MTVEAILLGTAQDGGVPQAGCNCAQCCLAHAEPDRRRWVSCLALVDHEAGQINHSNPLHTPDPERDWLATQGFGVGALGARWRLE